jgi:uncharacterized membrane protein
MADFTGTIHIAAPAGAVFSYLSEVHNLPHYFTQMTSAELGTGEEIHTTARTPDGRTHEADAWFRVDEDAQRIEWGSEGPNDYHGHVEVRPDGEGSEAEVHVHTTRVEDGDEQARKGINDTLQALKEQVEGGAS